MDTTLTGKIGQVKDIDVTLDQFIVNFKNDFALNIPAFPFITEREFLRNAKEFYASRGSEASYKFLLKILFGKESEIFYPETTTLRVSDGRWIQEISVQVELISGDVNSIVGKTVNVVLNETILFLSVLKTKRITDTLYEVFIERPQFGEPKPGAIISFGEFSGTIMPVISKITLVTPGSGFRVGQFYDLSTPTGKNAKIRLIAIDADKGAKTFQIVKFGQGFSNSAFNSLIKSSVTTATITTVEPIEDSLGPLVDSGFVTRSNFFLTDFAEPAYSAIVLARFNDALEPLLIDTSLDSDKAALIKVDIGGLSKYPGFYSESRGFLSDIIKLQDNYYHQLYSYVVKIDEQLNSYKSIIKSLLHPAGMELFGELNKNSSLNLAPSLKQLNALQQLLLQELLVITQIRTFQTSKVLSDTIPGFTDSDIYSFTKGLSDEVSFTDDFNRQFQAFRTFNDNSTISDLNNQTINKVLESSLSHTDDLTIELDAFRAFNDNSTISDLNSQNINKAIESSLSHTDDLTIELDSSRIFNDNITISDLNNQTIGKAIESSLSHTDILSIELDASRIYNDNITISDLNNQNINKSIESSLSHSDFGALYIDFGPNYTVGTIGSTSFFFQNYTTSTPSLEQATW
jgi:hypothetical protein